MVNIHDHPPRLTRIKNGWAASSMKRGDRWAVHGATQEEAVRKFEEALARHKEIDARPPFHERLSRDNMS